jgi:hypothetical protein
MILKQTGKLAPADEPCRLLRDMVDDLELQETCAEVEIDTSLWHVGSGFVRKCRQCRQCPAGVVMSRRLGVDTNRTVRPTDFPNECNRLRALDCFRCGDVGGAFLYLGIERPKSLPGSYDMPIYRDNPSEFKSALRALADDIERAMNSKEK